MPQSNAEKNRKIYARRPDKNVFRSAYECNKKYILATQSHCAICGEYVDKTLKSPHPMSASIDHIIPISAGGHPSNMDNLQLAHRKCNRMKGSKLYTRKREEQRPIFIQSRDWRKE